MARALSLTPRCVHAMALPPRRPLRQGRLRAPHGQTAAERPPPARVNANFQEAQRCSDMGRVLKLANEHGDYYDRK